MVITDKYVLFWGGIYSNWYKAWFNIDGVLYSHVEQYMMWYKAKLFGDTEAMGKIMESRDPKEQKAIGRTVKNFNQEEWENVCRDVVFDACYAKFSQNPHIKKQMLETDDSIFVEASPLDNIWGIGLHEDDPEAQDETKWKGLNWLGITLNKVRDKIKTENI